MIASYVWVGFVALIIALMALDLGVFNRKARVPTAREALFASALWIGLALLFDVFVYFAYEYKWFGLGLSPREPMDGREAAVKYLTAYLLEESLSMDNLFVMALVFAQFRVPKAYQHRVLFWGILGVLVFRGLLIGIGLALVHYFTWLFYLFGALLLWSAYKMWRNSEAVEEAPSDHGITRFLRRFYPISSRYDGGQFFTVEGGRRVATPLLVALLVIETSDIMFALDSVPAVFSITTDSFLVFSSNIFAILGLRSLFFVLSNMLDRFVYLNYSMIAILSFIGLKMILLPLHIHIHELVSLTVIGVLLAIGVIASLKKPTLRGINLLVSEERDSTQKPPFPVPEIPVKEEISTASKF
ncbi:MAG: TerC family protein [Saprospiraceae bacterium]|nr:TerC family protein [Saprospiraceae bacterium]MDW8483374.1 TerC family protein [Saprospiraceae bacterium]